MNYSIKSPQYSYEKEFDRIKEKYNLKGQIKTVSNIACEYIITSDHDYFERIGEEETKRFFEIAYKFVSEYKELGEQYIMSAKVHMDEQTPHMHLVFLPVVHTKDKKGNDIDKLACSEFWKAKDSYRQLQDAFYNYMVQNGFELQRGIPREETGREHYSVEEYKKITNFKQTKEILNNMGWKSEDEFETIHNYIGEDNIIRKGAISCYKDEKILIPLNMADGSLICIGKGNADWNNSAPHGAGRALSRTQAKEQLTMQEYKKQMKNIFSSCVSIATLDEAPMAYKNSNEIIKAIEPTAEIIDHLKPLYNFKAEE